MMKNGPHRRTHIWTVHNSNACKTRRLIGRQNKIQFRKIPFKKSKSGTFWSSASSENRKIKQRWTTWQRQTSVSLQRIPNASQFFSFCIRQRSIYSVWLCLQATELCLWVSGCPGKVTATTSPTAPDTARETGGQEVLRPSRARKQRRPRPATVAASPQQASSPSSVPSVPHSELISCVRLKKWIQLRYKMGASLSVPVRCMWNNINTVTHEKHLRQKLTSTLINSHGTRTFH